MISRHQALRAGLALGFTSFAASFAFAQSQVTFSVDWQGPTVGTADSSYGFPIQEGDTLIPAGGVPQFGPMPAPGNSISGGIFPNAGLGLPGYFGCFGHPGGTPCIMEVDAISYGTEPLTGPGAPLVNKLTFSVDRQARGLLSNAFPDVMSEAAFGDAASDVFLDLGLGVGPLAPFTATLPGNLGVVDGNGMTSGSGALYKGVGISEPSCGTCSPVTGDNLDAFATRPGSASFPAGGVYFSLDDNFVDPMTGVFNTGSAQAYGFTGGDVLRAAAPGGPPALYAAAGQLGLNLWAGGRDDLDALTLRENGVPGYQPSLTPNDWMNGATDMLLFSVRRGSFLVGQPDSIFGIPISEGDVLTTPLFGSPNPNPGIYIAAENLGLMARIAGAVNDDLDALDILSAPLNDCNGNGVDDALDILNGTSWDVNSNGVPDECELITKSFCFCIAPGPAPCGNFYAPGGCMNSTGAGAIMTASGTTSCTNDNLVLTTVQMPINKPGLLLMSKFSNPGIPFMDGILCIGPQQIFRHPPKSTGANGTFSYGPGLVNWTQNNFGPQGWILPSFTWNFQSWFRDPAGPCGNFANLSNAVSATFTP